MENEMGKSLSITNISLPVLPLWNSQPGDNISLSHKRNVYTCLMSANLVSLSFLRWLHVPGLSLLLAPLSCLSALSVLFGAHLLDLCFSLVYNTV